MMRKMKDREQKASLIVRHRPAGDERWYDKQFNDTGTPSDELVQKYAPIADVLLRDEIAAFEQITGKSGDAYWLSTIAEKGTQSDRRAALTLRVQSSPVHTINMLERAVAAVSDKKRREATALIDTLRELFVISLLPPKRKLVALSRRNLESLQGANANDKLYKQKLVYWAYEDRLKRCFESFVRAVEKWSHDPIEPTRVHACQAMTELLLERPEQEQFLLCSLVNKLGDRSGKVAAKVCGMLERVVQTHRGIKTAVVDQIERLVYRQNVTLSAQHYGMHFLSQMMLQRGEVDLAVKMLTIYFNIFKILVQQQTNSSTAIDQKHTKLLTVLLSGTNRAYPYAKGKMTALKEEVDTLYRVAATAPFGTSLQTLALLYHVMDTDDEEKSEATTALTDRYYSALYRQVLQWSVLRSTAQGDAHTKLPLLFSLIYKAAAVDSISERVHALLKRVLQVALHDSPAFACAALMVVSKVQYAQREAAMKALKTAPKSQLKKLRMKAKEAVSECNAVRLKKVAHTDGEVKSEPAENGTHILSDDDEYEHYKDADKEEEEEKPSEVKEKKPTGWIHRNIKSGAKATAQAPYAICEYDPLTQRNPLFTHGENQLTYELRLLTKHYHPSVALYAQCVLKGEKIQYDGDPLHDFTLQRFLDRFVYRNPKKRKVKREEGEETDVKLTTGKRVVGKRMQYAPQGVKALAVTDDEYLLKDEKAIPVDEQFLHRFMCTVGGPKKEDLDDDARSVASDEFDAIVDEMVPGGANDAFDLDYEHGITARRSTKRTKRKKEESDDEWSDEESENEDEGGDVGDDVASAEKFESMLQASGKQQRVHREDFKRKSKRGVGARRKPKSSKKQKRK